ncbi:MAG: hypothetical protein ACHQE6_08885 [Solirubrobacterales bacterium]
MFSIINTGFIPSLVWYSPGPRAISTLAPRFAQPVSDPRRIPRPSPIPPATASLRAAQPATSIAPTDSHTPASSGLRESSHTQEFIRARRTRWGASGPDRY